MDEQEVTAAYHVLLRDRASAVTGADQQAATVALHAAHSVDQFMDALRHQDRVVVLFHITLVIDLHQHVAPAAGQYPRGGLVGSTDDRCLVAQALVLTEIEVTEYNHHAELVRGIEDACHARGERRPQTTVFGECAGDPRLGLRIALGGTALEVDGERQQPVRLPRRHRGNELAHVALGIPRSAVGIGPAFGGLGIEVVEHTLDHA